MRLPAGLPPPASSLPRGREGRRGRPPPRPATTPGRHQAVRSTRRCGRASEGSRSIRSRRRSGTWLPSRRRGGRGRSSPRCGGWRHAGRAPRSPPTGPATAVPADPERRGRGRDSGGRPDRPRAGSCRSAGATGVCQCGMPSVPAEDSATRQPSSTVSASAASSGRSSNRRPTPVRPPITSYLETTTPCGGAAATDAT